MTEQIIEPTDFLADSEEDFIQDETTDLLALAALGLFGAFLTYRAYMQMQIRRELKKEAFDLGKAISASWTAYRSGWVKTVAPHIVSGYIVGVREIHDNTIPQEALQQIAETYARDLGDHINDISS